MTKAQIVSDAWDALQAATSAFDSASAAKAQAEANYNEAINMPDDAPPPPAPRRTFDVTQSSALGPWYVNGGYPALGSRWVIQTTAGALIYGEVSQHLTILLEAVFGPGQTEGVLFDTPGEISFNAATQVAQLGIQNAGNVTILVS